MEVSDWEDGVRKASCRRKNTPCPMTLESSLVISKGAVRERPAHPNVCRGGIGKIEENQEERREGVVGKSCQGRVGLEKRSFQNNENNGVIEVWRCRVANI